LFISSTLDQSAHGLSISTQQALALYSFVHLAHMGADKNRLSGASSIPVNLYQHARSAGVFA
jgi:hypothetical protein